VAGRPAGGRASQGGSEAGAFGSGHRAERLHAHDHPRHRLVLADGRLDVSNCPFAALQRDTPALICGMTGAGRRQGRAREAHSGGRDEAFPLSNPATRAYRRETDAPPAPAITRPVRAQPLGDEPPTHAGRPPMAAILTEVDTLVTITVTPPSSQTGGNWTLTYFPRRWNETVLYHTPQNGNPKPNLPRTVNWEVNGLQSGQTLEMQPKPSSAARGRLKGTHKIVGPESAYRSPQAGPDTDPSRRIDCWEYSLILKDANNRVLAQVDPDVIIVEDP